MKLDGRELLVLQACRDLPKDQYDNVHDDEIARETRLPLPDVKAVLESLDGRELVSKVRLSDDHYAAQITSNGILELSQRSPLPDGSKKDRIEAIPIKVVPKGLRSFDKNDADYFLELLPDYPGQGKLPESIEYWKSRIEETQVDLTFRVGVIYGPSGCGKTSLVKAGLLPRLSNNILTVAIEATPDDTEARLLTGVQTRCADLPKNLGLVDSLAALHWDGAFPPGKKLLLVLDQFEQWLLAKRGQENTELVNALRHCDGNRVQAIIMVRDEYYGPTDPLQRELGIEFRRNLNSFRVEPFSQPHARKVLAAFGRGSERLREGPTPEQEEFIEQAVAGLAVDNTVMPVRLALFTQLFRGREWSPRALREIGGTERVGFIFLEETLVSRYADPRHKRHLSAIQSVLKVLLPESGTDIKGNMKSHRTLLEASGYGARPNEFDALLGILDGELRLITPTEPEGRTPEDRQDQQLPGERYYQLTHDYLVPSIREWLTRKQKETRRGRAELLLADRSSLWNAKPENRHLPSAWEACRIRCLTKKREWTDPQRKMMRKAGRVHAVRGLVALLLLLGAALTGLMIQHQISVDKQATTAVGLVQRLLDADTAQVPEIVRSMSAYRRWIDPELKKIIGEAADTSSRKLHASLALLPVDPSQVDYIYSRLLNATPGELPILRDALGPHQSQLTPKLWSVLESAKPGDKSLLPAASALAIYDRRSPRWESAGGKVSEALATVNSVYLGPWLEALRPVRDKLGTPLIMIFREKRPQAMNILIDYAGDDPTLVADLLMGADPKAYAGLFRIAQSQAGKSLPIFQAEIDKKPPFLWNDPALDPSWTKPETTLVSRIESAQGMLTERFAFCQTMPLDEFLSVAEGLQRSGHRPMRLRPYADGHAVQVAAIWTRDGRPWRIASDVTADEIRQHDERNKRDQFLPVDVAGYVATSSDGKQTDRFSALWVERASPNDDAKMYVGVTSEDRESTLDRLQKEKLIPRASHAMRGTDGRTRYSGVWGRYSSVVQPSYQFYWDLSEVSFRQNQASQSDKIILDAAVSGSEQLWSTRERAKTALEAAEKGLKLKPDDLNTQFGRATAYFQLGEDRKALDDLRVLIEKAPQFVNFYQYRAIAYARLGQKKEALDDLAKFQKGDATENSKLYLAVIVAAELGEGVEQAFKSLEAVLQEKSKDIELLYVAACAYSLASQATAKRDQAKGKAHAERAIHLLQAAVRNGYADYNHMQEDADLDPIRDLAAFAEVMKVGHLDRQYTAVWTDVDVRFEANPILGLDPTAHLQRCRELVSQSYRIAALSIAKTTAEGPLVTASVWHRPVVSEQAKDQLAERQARAAISLIRLGHAEEVWPLLRHKADPRLRSYLVNWLSPLGADPKLLVAELNRIDTNAQPASAQGQQAMDAVLFHTETSIRRALILALGQYGREGLSSGERELLIGKLLDLYRNDPDAGIHGATEWTLRRWKQQAKLKEIDAELRGEDKGDRRWYVNSQGQTFAVIEQVEFRIGSPPLNEPEFFSVELPHQRVIPHRFAIAAKEVTVGQYEEFVKENPGVDHAKNDRYSPDRNGPMNDVTWYHAAAYCNWLSRKEKLPECYEPNDQGQYAEGMNIRVDALRRTGYRLPTEAEWEYACRAGTGTSRYYGRSVDLLRHYAWCGEMSQDRALPCGSLLPNDLGLFDMLGNVREWCQDQYDRYELGKDIPLIDIITTSEYINGKTQRPLQGGSFNDSPLFVRSSTLMGVQPSVRSPDFGFRPSRTYP